jgi:hypothetical protein
MQIVRVSIPVVGSALGEPLVQLIPAHRLSRIAGFRGR